MKPNILLIMTDQLRADAIGCYGADWIDTPNLDRLARQGTRFTNCTVNNPICTPSRASIMTGQEIPGHGVYRLHDVLPEQGVLFPARLRDDAGYRTALFGKLHVSGRAHEELHRHPNDGFETYEWCIESCVSMESRFNGYVSWLRDRDPAFLAELKNRKRKVLNHPAEVHFTRWAAERTERYIRENANKPEPFFCMMSLFDPHNPYQDYPPEMAGKVKRARIPKPVRKETLPVAALRERQGSYLGNNISSEEIEEMKFGYGASIAFADQEIGKVLAVLDECGIAEDTLVIFMSDHGDALGDHGMMVKGVALYDSVVKVPLILRWPGRVPAGHVCDALVQGHDLAGTCLVAARLDVPTADSTSFSRSLDLVALTQGRKEEERTAAFCAYRNSGINSRNEYWNPQMNATACITQTHKLIVFGSGDETEYELFDLVADPRETHDCSDDPDQVAVLRDLLMELTGWLQREASHAGSRGGSTKPRADSFMDNTLRGSN